MADDRIITALDVHSLDDMKKLVETLGDSVSFYKVGMELFYSAGPDAVRYLKDQGKHVFLDLKVHDIPNTVAQSIRALTRLGADLMTLHGTGGRAMMEAAAEAVRDEAAKLNIERPRLLAVTVLTSIDEDAWKEIGGKYSIAESVKNLAKLAKEAGIDGTVSSPYEAKEIPGNEWSRFPHRHAGHPSDVCRSQRPEAVHDAVSGFARRGISFSHRPSDYQGRRS